jgi:hypothetical protein
MTGWPISNSLRVYRKSSAGEITHPNTAMAFGGLTSEVPRDPSYDQGLKPPVSDLIPSNEELIKLISRSINQ